MIDASEFDLLRSARSRGGGVAGGDAFQGAYPDVSDTVAERLRVKGLFEYRGFSEWWAWFITDEGREAVSVYEEAQIQARQLWLPFGSAEDTD